MWTYHTYEWCSDGPTELPEHEWVVANHVFDAIIKSIYSKCPWNSNTFKEDQEQETEATNSIWIKDLENIHSTLKQNNVKKHSEHWIILSWTLAFKPMHFIIHNIPSKLWMLVHKPWCLMSSNCVGLGNQGNGGSYFHKRSITGITENTARLVAVRGRLKLVHWSETTAARPHACAA